VTATPFTEAGLRKNIWPRFSRVLQRPGIYLANHSLGRPLDQMALDAAEFASLWYSDMNEAWTCWQAELDRFATNIERLIGAESKTIIHRASAGQGLRAVLNSFNLDRPMRIVTTGGEFDSLDFILRAYQAAGRCEVTWVEPEVVNGVPTIDSSAVLDAVTEATDLVVVSHVFFGTGQVFSKLDEFVRKCQERGALVLVDLYHSVGAVPLSISQVGPDFAVGGSYKYLRGGPGASWLYVSRGQQSRATLDTGWFAKPTALEFQGGSKELRQQGIGGWAESTPPVIASFQARSGLELVLELGVDRIRAYSLEKQAQLRSILSASGITCHDPLNPESFGAFSLVPSSRAKEAVAFLATVGVTADARGQLIRLCPDILNSDAEFEVAAERFSQAQKLGLC
jgi:kynureninase